MGYKYFMYNSKRTIEIFGYDLLSAKRRSKEEVAIMGGRKPKDMPVIDNCPSCNEERQVNLNQSRKNKPCSKCFHNSPEMVQAKQNQNKIKSEETKQKMRDSHWSKNGVQSPFKGQRHSKSVKEVLSKLGLEQFTNLTSRELELHKIKSSLQRGRTIETFTGFTTSESTRIRQSAEGKAWTYDVLSKSNFTCVKCDQRGGKLHAHHLNGFNLFPEQRFDINNGTCLCESCHGKFHEVYGKGDNTKDQFDEWVNSKAI